MDGQDFTDVETYGREKWLGELAQELKEESYRPEAVRQVYIKKSNGKMRPLGIPTLRDRVCQRAGMLVLGPVFEADLPTEQYAYRAGVDALCAVKEVHRLINLGHREVVDADLSGYFDSIPHAELMTSIARRIVDRRMLHLMKMWLEAKVEETDAGGEKKCTTRNRDEGRGIPQGSPISPLLANVYMRRFVLGWQRTSLAKRLGARIVNYADDLVVCCWRKADEALEGLRRIMTLLSLTVNEEKTRLCRVPEGEFDFLGYTFGRRYTPQGRAYLGSWPSKRSVKWMMEAIREQTDRRGLPREAVEVVKGINRKLNGWANYFRLGPVSKAYRAIDAYTTERLRRWLCDKRQERGRGIHRYPEEYLYKELGLVRLWMRTQGLPWAKA